MIGAEPFASIADLEVRRQESLAAHTTFRVGGPAEYYLIPRTWDALQAALRRVRDERLELFVLGAGTNVLVADAGFGGVVIQIDHNLERVELADEVIRVEAGVRLPALAPAAAREGLAGLEALAGVPGTVGGALGINAGAFGQEFGPLVVSVDGFTVDGEPRRYGASEIVYGYRSAVYPEPIVFTGAEIRLTRDDPEAIAARAAGIRARRAATQPTRSKCAGCAFKNPPGASAGQSIDRAGLKGFRVGGAEVSTIHANYLVNTGDATADDIRRLIETVQERVLRSLGIRLEAEVRMLGFSR